MLLGHEPDRAARSGGCRSICPYRMAEYQRGCFVILVAHVAIPERPPGRIPDTLFDGGRRISNGARGVHGAPRGRKTRRPLRSEEHTSELQSLMRISYAVFCLKQKNLLTAHSTAINNTCKI